MQLTVGLEVLSDFTDQALERQLADQKLSRPVCQPRALQESRHSLLVTTDLSESHGTRSVSMRLLDTTSGGGRGLAGSLGGD